ncbi:hypothetical protein VaNZ11_001826 [Volvox africanus]|uniref:Uncharacterized protein n=1 Tax=Volvox africanus TaxID=51714 RepID=A0ABQ5RQI9_9CHLO|nr:hypothetical protein VaNZ11_001826 [Volvox africanus]
MTVFISSRIRSQSFAYGTQQQTFQVIIHMALQVNLTLSKTYFLPGEVVQVCVQIFNNETESALHEASRVRPVQQVLHIKELSFQANGSERTDSSFIYFLHRPEVPAEVVDSRKRVRCIFATESAVLVSDKVLAPHAMQSFQLRFRLPAALPPSFRGSAVRFFYMIHVKAVYEVQRGHLEAVVYETTASTTLTVWPKNYALGGNIPASSGTIADRRTSSFDSSLRSLVSGACEPSASDVSKSTTHHVHGRKTSDLGCTDSKLQQPSGAGNGPAAVSFSTNMPLHSSAFLSSIGSSSHVGLSSSSDDSDVTICDYALGRSCRIRWREVQHGNLRSGGMFNFNLPCSDGGSFPAGAAAGAAAGSSPESNGGKSAGSYLLSRGVIPFGVNRPFDASFPLHFAQTLETDSHSQSDSEDVTIFRRSATDCGMGGHGYTPKQSACNSSMPAESAPRTQQRQLSGGASGVTGFSRYPSRRSSLFGKVYMLNMGDQPLLRVLLHAPLEVPLQPGATFGGVMDFRQPIAISMGQHTVKPPMICYGVAILLETEEVISPECRPQNKREGGGVSTVIRRLHAEHHELACDSALTSFMFSLPATATPSFRTPMVSLRWVLRFELHVGPRISFSAVDKRASPMRPQLEQLIWALPLSVRPPIAIAR